MRLRKPRTIITATIITGITAVAAPTGTIIGLTGRGEVIARRRPVKYLWLAFRLSAPNPRTRGEIDRVEYDEKRKLLIGR